MTTEHDLADKLRKLEALFANPGTDGERAAAGSALDRIRERLRRLERTEQAHELRYSLPDEWSRALFVALARRYGLKPYRLRGQRRTTVMLHVVPSFADETFWPEFLQLHDVLHHHLERVTRELIARAVHHDSSDAAERPAIGAGGESGARAAGGAGGAGAADGRQAGA